MPDSITVKELRQMIPGAKIIDIRENYMFNLGCIPTAVNIPMTFLLTNPDSYLNKQDTYYIYCEKGAKSRKTCINLTKQDYKVINVIGGYDEYKNLKNTY